MDSNNTKESLVIAVCPIIRYGNYFVNFILNANQLLDI